MDKFRIDNHKLNYHSQRVADWLSGKNIYPIYAEISPSGECNHRCTFCALDFMEYQPKFLNTNILKTRLTELSQLGLKSVMYGGEGEPLLHESLPEIINHTKSVGIDVALTTNGVLLTPQISDYILKYISWIKVSFNAGTKETYAKIHRTKPRDFDTVIKNLIYAVRQRNFYNYKCTLGMQTIFLPENRDEIFDLAELAKSIGMDYLVVKPYSQHPLSRTTKYKDIKYCDYQDLADELDQFNSDNFNVIFRDRTMRKWDTKERNYDRCNALNFWTYIDASGNVWGCSMYLGDERFRYGNIYDNTFKDIWEGSKCSELKYDDIDVSKCRINCRMDKVNQYLYDLLNPPEHVNFI